MVINDINDLFSFGIFVYSWYLTIFSQNPISKNLNVWPFMSLFGKELKNIIWINRSLNYSWQSVLFVNAMSFMSISSFLVQRNVSLCLFIFGRNLVNLICIIYLQNNCGLMLMDDLNKPCPPSTCSIKIQNRISIKFSLRQCWNWSHKSKNEHINLFLDFKLIKKDNLIR